MADISDILSRLTIDEKPGTKQTGLVYDNRMIEHRCIWDPNHIEKPERFIFPLERCKNYGLVQRCTEIPSRFADEIELSLVHSPEYVELMKKTRNSSDSTDLETLSSAYDSVYFHPKTYQSALLSAGCVLELVSSVVERKVDNGMAIVRPPGHHAMAKEPCGFCFFNNVALAAKHCLLKYNLQRILIVDWDVHHGQGTQQMFYDDQRVLYFSIHRYEHGNFWPYLRESNFDCIGEGSGKGFNINVPLNKTGLGNSEYFSIFNNILLPVAYEFNPELVLISAGYDAALGCPEGEMEVTPHAYAHLLNSVSALAGGRVCVILEGGYCLPSLSESVAMTLRTLLGDPCPEILPTDLIDDNVVEVILNVVTTLRPFWQSLRLQKEYESDSSDENGEQKHKVSVKYHCSVSRSVPYPTREDYPVQESAVRLALETKLEKLIGKTNLSVPDLRTCLVSDFRMNQHVNKKEKWHPECGERLTKIHEILESSGLLKKCFQLVSRMATEAELCLVHSENYISEIKSTVAMKKKEIMKMQAEYQSVYICPETYESAIMACGCLLQTLDAVLSGKCTNGFALIRPPGHHAEKDEACGFCIFNSVAVAAKYAMSKYSVKKVLILDWDVHHGNGTQHIFYGDNNVLYISLHRYDGGSFFPSESDASHEACGEGAGAGFNINIPWNGIVGDGDYLSAFCHIILPVAYEFCPDLVLVSAGYDAAENDPLGGCNVTPAFFGHMTKLLSGLANGKIILALEGGYNLESISSAVHHCVSVMLGEPCSTMPSALHPSDSAIETIRNVVRVQQKYWKCLQFGVSVPTLKANDDDRSVTFDNSVISTPVTIPNVEEETEEPGTSNEAGARVDYLSVGGANSDWGDGCMMYCISPLDYCPHLELLQSLPAEGLNPLALCQICNDPRENWVCLHCYQVYCGRYINEHMYQHGLNMQHYLTLSYSDLSVWCYACDSYIHNEMLMPVKEHVHSIKFPTN